MSDTKRKAGFVAIIGRPNVGKSTLMNTIIGQKIAITSNKPQTTRNRIRTVYTTDNEQIVFVDTPGIHKSKNKLGEYMVTMAETALKDVDAVLFLVEPTCYIGAGEKHIIEILSKAKAPVILVVNKIDTVSKEDLMKAICTYNEQMDFAEVVPVSAMKNDNTEELIKCILKYMPEGEFFFDEDTVTDQPMRQITAEIIREKALKNLNDEIPHGIAVTIETMDFGRRLVDINATIICERDSHKGIIIGKQGSMLKKIGIEARRDIEDMVEMQVNLKLFVKVRKDWRDSDIQMKNFGYDLKEDSKK